MFHNFREGFQKSDEEKRPYFTLFSGSRLRETFKKVHISHFLERIFKKVKEKICIFHTFSGFRLRKILKKSDPQKRPYFTLFLDSRLREFSKKVEERNAHISHFFQAPDLGRISKKVIKKVHISHFVRENFQKSDEEKRAGFTRFRLQT